MNSVLSRRILKMLFVALLGILLLEDVAVAFVATEAAYKDDEESGENKIYRGIVVKTKELNIRPAAGKIDSYVLVDGKYIALKEGDEVAVLGEEGWEMDKSGIKFLSSGRIHWLLLMCMEVI